MWVQVKVGGEPNGFWEYGGRCLGNRSVGCDVTGFGGPDANMHTSSEIPTELF